MVLDPKDIDFGRSKNKVTYFSKKVLQPGESLTLNIVDVEKNHSTKFPIMGQDFCYRFILSDGRVWDEATGGIFGKILTILYPDGKTLKPSAVVLTKLTVKPVKGSQYTIDPVKVKA